MAPTPPTPCEVCTRAFALKKPDPDGGRRCFSHSTDPVIAARRQANADKGRAAGEKQRGLKVEDRHAVLAGVVPIEQAREQAREARQKAERAKATIEPIPLDTKENVLRFLGRAAGELMAEQPNGWASAAASLANAALKAMGVEGASGEEEEGEAPRGFVYETTTGDPVRVRGRGDGPVH